jgi:hypothetical protein
MRQTDEFTENAMLDRSNIVGIEARLRNPSIQSVTRIAKALGIVRSDRGRRPG